MLYSLGLAYARGEGVDKDYNRAYIWTSLAASSKGIDNDTIKQAVQMRDISSKLINKSVALYIQENLQNLGSLDEVSITSLINKSNQVYTEEPKGHNEEEKTKKKGFFSSLFK